MLKTSKKPSQAVLKRQRRYQKGLSLLRKWVEEDSGYDEEVWDIIEEELKDSSVRFENADEYTT